MPGTHRTPHRTKVRFSAVLALLVVLALVGLGIHALGQRGSGENASPGTSARASPSTSPATTTPSPTRPVHGRLVIHGAGDVSLDPDYIPNFRSQGFAYAWSGLNGLFRRDDLTVVNLECAVSDIGSPIQKEFLFRGDPAGLPAMKAAGVDVANMGNNHSYDYGPQALLDTRRNLLAAGIAPVGAGKDPAEALKPALFDVDGWRIAVVGFDKIVGTYPTAVAAPGHPGTAAGHDLDLMVRTVRAVASHSDLTVVVIHWGVELDSQPRADDVELGHRFIDAGADVVFGSHSHRLQSLDFYKGRPIFWSLGNFVWPNFSTVGSTTAVAEVTVSPAGKFSARLIPAFIESDGHPVRRGS